MDRTRIVDGTIEVAGRFRGWGFQEICPQVLQRGQSPRPACIIRSVSLDLVWSDESALGPTSLEFPQEPRDRGQARTTRQEEERHAGAVGTRLALGSG